MKPVADCHRHCGVYRQALPHWSTWTASQLTRRRLRMSTQELDRSMLDAKDREELHAIAGAMGVKAPTRMRKSELIDAILDAAEGDAPDAGGKGDQPAE